MVFFVDKECCRRIIKYSAIDEGAAFQKNTRLFANPYCYFDLNKSIAWRYDGRDGLSGGECQKVCGE